MKRQGKDKAALRENPITTQSCSEGPCPMPLNNSTTIRTSWQFTKEVSPAFLRLLRALLQPRNTKESKNNGESKQ